MTRHYTPVSCPHCGAGFLTHTVASHARKCAFAPDIFAATKTALDDGTGRIVSSEIYRKSTPTGAISASALGKQIGNWQKVAEIFGLRYEPNFGYHPPRERVEMRECPDVDTPEPDPVVEALEYHSPLVTYTPHGFAHCGVCETEKEVRWVLR